MNKYLKISLRTLLFVCLSALTIGRSMGQNSLYTGQAPIGIPLYTVSDGKAQIPIGLNYNAAGIRPNEHPGWVGQNWNLQAGGFIARKINGLPDDMKADFKVPALNGRVVNVKGFYFNYSQLDVINWDSTTTLKNTLVGNYDRYMQLLKSDTEPDEFYFSLPNGSSGSFLLNEKGEWTFKGTKVMKVKLLGFLKAPFKTWYTTVYRTFLGDVVIYDCIKDTQNDVCTRTIPQYSSTFKGFMITDDAGTEYTFGGDSTNISYSIPFSQQYFTHWKADVWHLTKVKPIGGQEITLSYDEYSEKYNGQSVGGRFSLNMILTAQKGSFCVGPNCRSMSLDTARVYSGDLIRPVYLRKIESVRDSIIFVKSRSVELEYPKKIFRTYYTKWNQTVRFFQRKIPNSGQQVDYTSPTANGWSPNTQNENWNTTDSLDKYLNDLAWVKLDKIKVYSKVAGETHAEIEYLLKYNNSNKSYTYQTIGNKIQRTGNFNERIRLDTIAQVASGKALIYKMDYYKNDTIPQPPYFDSNGLVDHWGFLNRKKYNLFDSLYYNKRESTKSIEIARIGTLKSITLPTGGRTVFDFEQNTYSKILDMGVIRVYSKETNPLVGDGYFNTYNHRRRGEKLYLQSVAPRTNPFGIINTKFGGYKMLAFKEGFGGYYYKVLTSTNLLNGGTLITSFTTSTHGLYVDSVKIDTVGGLRIKSIKSIDQNGNFIGKKTYEYNENYGKANSLISSGILDYRYVYNFPDSLEKNAGWDGGKYRVDATTNTVYDGDSPTGTNTDRFFASNGAYNSPVTYNEVTEKNYDNSYTTYHFTNYYSTLGGEHLDDLMKSYGYSPELFKPTIDKSFERGRIIMVESFRSDGKQIAKSKVNYKSLAPSFVKTAMLNSSLMGVSTRTTENIFNSFINVVVFAAGVIGTAGSYSLLATLSSTLSTPISLIFPSTTTNSYMHFSEYAYARKIYTFNYETTSDSSWTFDYNDPSKKIITSNFYKYNINGQIRELKRVQNDGLEILTNNKYVSDYDFVALQNSFTNPTSCITARTNCEAACATEPDPQVQDYCYRNCAVQEDGCRQIAFSNSIVANPTSNNILKMQMKNMVGYTVESIVKRKNINTSVYKILGGTLNIYGEFNANGTLLYAPQSILKMKQTQTNSTADTSKIDATGAFVYDLTRYTVKAFETTAGDGYGNYGNLTKYMGRDGVSNTITHNAMNYPISKNMGITYGGNEFYSTMEYAPILGMIKTADQNNRKIRNRYDEFNRLRSVSKTLSEGGQDNDYLLKLYNYHYFNDNSDITISDFVVGGCNGDNPVSCTLRATIAPNSFVEMKIGSGLTTTITGSFDAGANTVTDAAKYTWINPAGTVSTTAAYTIPALTAVNLSSVLGVYYYKVEKGGCQSCLKFTISKKTTATDPDLLAEEDK